MESARSAKSSCESKNKDKHKSNKENTQTVIYFCIFLFLAGDESGQDADVGEGEM